MSKCALCKTSLKDDEINVCDKCRLDFLNFKQQLSEKDKEIKRLKYLLLDKENKSTFFEQLYNQTIEDAKIVKDCGSFTALNKIIRKQVCDEIREMALDYYYFQGDAEKFDGNLYLISKFDLENILDQIEQAKESMNEDIQNRNNI